eukprot:Colp12_sorted_trinity150504_noHs@11948
MIDGIGIGLDSCVVPLRHKDLCLVQTTDFFYPLVDDPYVQGQIACANVLSDLYAMGVTECDNMLMLLGVSRDLTRDERDVVVPMAINGFNAHARLAGTAVRGGQTVLNPWFLIGGVATAVCSRSEFIMPDQAQVGDVLVLTKPLGTQVSVNAHQWLDNADRLAAIADVITTEEVVAAYEMSMASMAHLNRRAAGLMHKHGSHGATDVTGFGILGHGQNLAAAQREAVDFVLHTLPCIKGMSAVNNIVDFGLRRGYSAETSGGLLVVLPAAAAQAYIDDVSVDGIPAYIVGAVVQGSRTARLADDVKIIEVEF